MPEYCSTSDKIAVVTLSKNGKSFEVRSSNPPVTVVCKNNDYPDCTKVDVQMSVVTDGSFGTATNQYTYALNAPILGVRIINNSKYLQVYCRGSAIFSCQSPGWITVADLIGTSGTFKSGNIISITPKDNTAPNTNKGVQIKDRNGAIIFDDNQVDCNWSVRCDDDCPSGQMKCQCSQFPGYCCISCDEIKSGIKAVTAQVRAISNG